MNKQQIFQMYGIGSKVETPDGVGTIENTLFDADQETLATLYLDANKNYVRVSFPSYIHTKIYRWIDLDECTLILRPLSSLTDYEKVKWYDVVMGEPYSDCSPIEKIKVTNNWLYSPEHTSKFSAQEFLYLLSLSINLFPNEINK